MAIRLQISKTLPCTADTAALTSQLVSDFEGTHPSKTHSVFVLKEGDVRDEYIALQAAASYAVRLPYVSDRVYVSMTSPAKNSRKRTADGDTYVSFAFIAYDYAGIP